MSGFLHPLLIWTEQHFFSFMSFTRLNTLALPCHLWQPSVRRIRCLVPHCTQCGIDVCIFAVLRWTVGFWCNENISRIWHHRAHHPRPFRKMFDECPIIDVGTTLNRVVKKMSLRFEVDWARNWKRWAVLSILMVVTQKLPKCTGAWRIHWHSGEFWSSTECSFVSFRALSNILELFSNECMYVCMYAHFAT